MSHPPFKCATHDIFTCLLLLPVLVYLAATPVGQKPIFSCPASCLVLSKPNETHRDRLRRALCDEVVPFAPGSKAGLILLQRQRESLVPDVATVGNARKDAQGTLSEEGGTDPASSVTADGGEDAGAAAGACPMEGNSSERFSRLVQAKTM